MKFSIILGVMFFLPLSANAQTWAEKQQQYNEKSNLEMELFHQREEMEKAQKEHERDMRELRQEIEEQNVKIESEKQEQDYWRR